MEICGGASDADKALANPFPRLTLLYKRSRILLSFYRIMQNNYEIRQRPTASRLSPVDLADFLARKDLAYFLHEVLLDFLAYSFAHSVS
jgi:hypothetical protein